MTWNRMCLAWATAALFAAEAAAQDAAPANTLHDLDERLGACLHAARGGGNLANGSEVTVLFALKRDGSLLGRPRITHASLIGDPNDQRLFLAGVLSAIDGCLPLDVTPSLGGAIAGRPIALRVVRGQWRVGI
ncbi:MAG: hypothetical protein JO223_01900 [Hyphomicrobiales bacterium]|nr:hypothetical protein [Hyphomicrobiales bacterium]